MSAGVVCDMVDAVESREGTMTDGGWVEVVRWGGVCRDGDGCDGDEELVGVETLETLPMVPLVSLAGVGSPFDIH